MELAGNFVVLLVVAGIFFKVARGVFAFLKACGVIDLIKSAATLLQKRIEKHVAQLEPSAPEAETSAEAVPVSNSVN